MRVDDVEGPVVNAAYRTPFEARRRVFVLERVDTDAGEPLHIVAPPGSV